MFMQTKSNIAQIFVSTHRSVVNMSDRMLLEMKRHNYVTPTNYLELVSGYERYFINVLFLSSQPFCFISCILSTIFCSPLRYHFKTNRLIKQVDYFCCKIGGHFVFCFFSFFLLLYFEFFFSFYFFRLNSLSIAFSFELRCIQFYVFFVLFFCFL